MMIFTETKLKGAFIIEPERQEDERGFFARTFCQEEFKVYGLNTNWVQCNISFNKKKGTLRGMHYQTVPYEEVKLVRCTMGSIYDVIIDLRPESHTFKQWASIELSSENRRMVYVPEKFAHGFETLTNNTEVFYLMSQFYHPKSSKGIRWNDPGFLISWPIMSPIMSSADSSYPNY